MNFDWTDDRVTLLRQLHEAGIAFSGIAAELGAGVTRNAVIGKASRMGLPGRGATSGMPPKPKAERKTPFRQRKPGSEALVKARTTKEIVRTAPAVADTRFACTLLALQHDSCRWVLGEPQGPATLYCGATKALGAYCATHARMAYRQPRTADVAAAVLATRQRRRALVQKLARAG